MSYGALCSDFYVNQKIALKLDLPGARETVLDMFDRIRRELPQMDRFRRYEGELALESPDEERSYCWAALRQTSVRSGWVNPESLVQAYRLHRLILETAPYFLSISPLDVDHLELVFGFDFEAERNRDAIVFNALLADTPLAALVDSASETVLEAQPLIGIALDEDRHTQAFLEIKTRGRPNEAGGGPNAEPISIYLTVRHLGTLRAIEDFTTAFAALAGHAERLAEQRVIPHIVVPIREAIVTGG
ncbi:MAG: hypothetical protein KDA22_16760 [Phycisphaerales bacterium]|nr:hypothetical protein [Phycisphaerales bacterium]